MSNFPDGMTDPVRERLPEATLDCFLADEYHKVTTRLIAEKAGANISMIRYSCFEEQMDRNMDAGFLADLARFNGRLFAAGLAPSKQKE